MEVAIDVVMQQAIAAHKEGNLQVAQRLYSAVLKVDPNNLNAQFNLSVLLAEAGRVAEAEVSYLKTIALKPDHADAHHNLGLILKTRGRLDESEAALRRSIACNSDPQAHRNLGNLLQDRGRLEEAKEQYVKAISLKPEFAEAHRNLADIKNFSMQDEQLLLMVELHRDPNTSQNDRSLICFALAKAFESLCDFGKAFKFYEEGNALRKANLDYDSKSDAELFRKIKKNHQCIAAQLVSTRETSYTPMPIFIVGMPRSGTTLVEQIVSAHSRVTGAGELPFASKFGLLLSAGLLNPDDGAVQRFRDEYLSAVSELANGRAFVTDKMPLNFKYLGLIATALPEAKIINVQRDPAAVCWSNYAQYFPARSMSYSFNLDDILNYYTLYEDLMKYWRQMFPGRIYDLDYQFLTLSQEEETRKLIGHMELDWEDACLSPQDNTRSVATASNAQVRQKVYKGSSEKWKRYLPFLNGALDHLSVGNQ